MTPAALCPRQEKADLGEVNFSLCYLPTAGRLTVTVIRASNLRAMDLTGFSGERGHGDPWGHGDTGGHGDMEGHGDTEGHGDIAGHGDMAE